MLSVGGISYEMLEMNVQTRRMSAFWATEQNSYKVIEKRDLGCPDSVIIHEGTNDLRRTGYLNYVMGDVYELVNTAKSKSSAFMVVLTGVLWRGDVSWQRIGAVNNR